MKSLCLRSQWKSCIASTRCLKSNDRSTVSVQREPSVAGEIPGQERIDIFIRPTSGDALQRLREPCAGINVIEARSRKQRGDRRPCLAAGFRTGIIVPGF